MIFAWGGRGTAAAAALTVDDDRESTGAAAATAARERNAEGDEIAREGAGAEMESGVGAGPGDRAVGVVGVIGERNTLLGGDLTAAAKDVGRGKAFIDAPGNTEVSGVRDLARELEVDMVSRSAIGFELGVPGGVAGTRLGDCWSCWRREAEEDRESIVAGLRGVCIDFERAAAEVLYLPGVMWAVGETGKRGGRLDCCCWCGEGLWSSTEEGRFSVTRTEDPDVEVETSMEESEVFLPMVLGASREEGWDLPAVV